MMTDSDFERLYHRHRGDLVRIARRILRNEADAEDVMQEAFAQAWSQRDRYDQKRGAPIAWLYTVARSRAIDCLRRAQTTRRSPIEHCLNAPALFAFDLCDIDAKRRRGRIRQAIVLLPPAVRQPFELAFIQAHTHVQIAAALSLPLGTVKTRIRSAVKQVRGTLGQAG